ncbi:hypothetical protein [Fructobacillus papyrifericola]|uniref:Uncharacterized protein n=1 Tax=Fructobacillus papyrifericola TaxID=2713172 RepID=A0ABS5QUT0_9LACO|nr:hypothetical protein [Fructobacillus papyrifericola]MBS9336089.1 hypothetical protein [Fructobacillus papyrifericola]
MEQLGFKVCSVSGLIDTKQLDNYSCGVAGLDEFIKYDYQDLERKHITSLNAVYLDDVLVGMFALSTSSSSASFADANREKIFGDASGMKSLPMINIDHLSVNKPFQFGNGLDGLHLGTAILKYIFKMLLDVGAQYGIAFAGVMVESLPDPVDFYISNGFYFIDKHEEDAPNKKTYTLAISYDDMFKVYE